jgi:hypothetical protein
MTIFYNARVHVQYLNIMYQQYFFPARTLFMNKYNAQIIGISILIIIMNESTFELAL